MQTDRNHNSTDDRTKTSGKTNLSNENQTLVVNHDLTDEKHDLTVERRAQPCGGVRALQT